MHSEGSKEGGSQLHSVPENFLQEPALLHLPLPRSVHAMALAMSVSGRSRNRLQRLRGLLASLGATPDDTLCLEPAGPLAVRASLIKGPAGAAALVSPRRRSKPSKRLDDCTKWRGLEPDSRRYTLPLSASGFKHGQLYIPSGCACSGSVCLLTLCRACAS